MNNGIHRRGMRLLTLLAVIIGTLVIWSSPADAHAELLTTEPTSGQVLQTAPDSITLRFSEAVTPTSGAIRLVNGEGDELEVPRLTHPNGDSSTLVTSVGDLDDGTYAAVWSVISADSHPIHGALTFQVGNVAPGTSAISTDKLLATDHADLSVRVIQGLLRGILIGATVIGIGALLLTLAFRTNEPMFLLAYRTAGWSLLAVGITTVFALFNHGLYVNAAPLTDFFDPQLANITLHTRYGYGAILRLAAVASVALVLPEVKERSAWRFAAFTAALCVVASFAVSGHAGTGRLPWAGLALDLAHVTAGCLWFGGLALVCFALFRKHIENESLREGVARFSKIAFACAITMIVTGLLQAWRQIHSWDVLYDTAYGRLVIVKTVIYVFVIALAWFSRKAIRRWTATGGDANERSQRKALRVSVGFEATLAVAIIAVTTILVATSPTLATTAERPSSFDRSSKIDNNIEVTLQVPRTQSGPTAFEVLVVDADKQPVDVPEVTIQLTLADQGIGPLPVTLSKTGPGRYATSNTVVPIPGIWTISVTVRTTEIDQSATSFAVKFV